MPENTIAAAAAAAGFDKAALLAMLAEAAKDPEIAAAIAKAEVARKESEKAEAERKAKEDRERFELIIPTLDTLVHDLADTHPLKKFTARKGKRAGQVTGEGFQATGIMPVTLDGITKEYRVTVFVKTSANGSAPADVTGDDADETADESTDES